MLLDKVLMLATTVGTVLFVAGAATQTIYERRVRKRMKADMDAAYNDRAIFILQNFATQLHAEADLKGTFSDGPIKETLQSIANRLQKKADALKVN